MIAVAGSGYRHLTREVSGNPHRVELHLPDDGSIGKVLDAVVEDEVLKNGHHIILHGGAVADILGKLAGDFRDYQAVDKIPGRKELPFQIDGFEGVRRVLGDEHVHRSKRVMQFEFQRTGSGQKYVATIHYGREGEVLLLIIPKKIALVAGHGTIASKVRWQLQRLGIEVYVLAYTARSNTRTAILQGAPIILHPESVVADFAENGMPYVSSDLVASLRTVPFDFVVEGLDGKSKGGGTASQALKKLIGEVKPGLPIVFQGGNDADIAPRVLETQTMQVLGLGPDFVAGTDWRSSVFTPSCNTHQYLHILAAIYGWNKTHADGDTQRIVEVELNGTAIRRSGDPGGGKAEAHPDGSAITLNYHHAPDVLAFDKQLTKELHIPFAINRDETPRFTTHATFGQQQRYHIINATLRARKVNGEYFTAKEFLDMLRPLPRVAVVEFEGKGDEVKIDPGRIYNLVHNQIDITHPFLEVITAQQSGDAITVIGLTWQESNVVPDNIAIALLLSGVVSHDAYGVERANGLANMVIGLGEIKAAIQSHSPLSRK